MFTREENHIWFGVEAYYAQMGILDGGVGHLQGALLDFILIRQVNFLKEVN
jgi:hypothetical protein